MGWMKHHFHDEICGAADGETYVSTITEDLRRELREVRRDAIRRLAHAAAEIGDEFRTCMIQWQGDNIIGRVGIPTADRARLYNAIDDLRRVLDMDEPPMREAAE